MQKRTVFFLSDRTGITSETLGHSLLTQFDGVEWRKISIAFLDSISRAWEVKDQIDRTATQENHRPIVFSTVINEEIRQVLQKSNAAFYDFFDTFIGSMEKELGQPSAHAIGRSHGVQNNTAYFDRISAINYSLNNDDGMSMRNLDEADVILVGVSRSGKTPTCLYMALQYGISAANYPLTEDDMDSLELPKGLRPYRNKLFGLTLNAEQLYKIRQERRPNSPYASMEQCRKELAWQKELYLKLNLPHLDTTNISIEEISIRILARMKLKRRLYGQ